MFDSVLNIAAGAMSANRLRINTIASNIANAQTTRTEEGGPYKRRDVVFVAHDVKDEKSFSSALDKASLQGVSVGAVVTDQAAPQEVFDPGHPDADPATGIVLMPNVNPVTEMANLITASTAYKAAGEVVSATKSMAQVLRQLASRF